MQWSLNFDLVISRYIIQFKKFHQKEKQVKAGRTKKFKENLLRFSSSKYLTLIHLIILLIRYHYDDHKLLKFVNDKVQIDFVKVIKIVFKKICSL